ncbi:MAG: hypothetical protein ACI9G1_003243, partial [Pirellulaceae bacterium]
MFDFFKRKPKDQTASKKTPDNDPEIDSEQPSFGVESLEARVLLSGTTLGIGCDGSDELSFDFDLLDGDNGCLDIGSHCNGDLLDGLIESDNPVDIQAADSDGQYDCESDQPRSGSGTDGHRSSGGTDGRRSGGGTDGRRSGGGTDGRRSGGGTDGHRSSGGTDGRRSGGG